MKKYLAILSTMLFVGLFSMALVSLAETKEPSKEDKEAVEKLLKVDAGVGAPYGARDPYKCESAKEPAKGPPTASQVRAYIIAGAEHVKGNGTDAVLILADNVTVEVGKGRVPDQFDGSDDIDRNEMVYPVKGTITLYTCHQINKVYAKGKNAQKIEYPKATGLLYKTTLGEWKCGLMDVKNRKPFYDWIAPPQ